MGKLCNIAIILLVTVYKSGLHKCSSTEFALQGNKGVGSLQGVTVQLLKLLKLPTVCLKITAVDKMGINKIGQKV